MYGDFLITVCKVWTSQTT